jgi:carbon storage regulator CsrA
MLVLSRKCQESVVIGGSVSFEQVLKVTVLEIRPGRVRLGFDVSDDVPVHRMEVWRRIPKLASRSPYGRTPSGCGHIRSPKRQNRPQRLPINFRAICGSE